MIKLKHIKSSILLSILLLLFLSVAFPTMKANAAEAAAVTIGNINYENLVLQVYTNNNTVIYYSNNKKIWNVLEGNYDNTSNSIMMDISWITLTSDYTLYFKGDANSTVVSVTLPSRNSSIKVAYDKTDGTFLFSNVEEAITFEWRKSTDYLWTVVNIEDNSSSYQDFIKSITPLREKGTKLCFRIPQVVGTGASNVGSRPSKEVIVTITKRANAPKIIVNATKLTLNTTVAMEYYDSNIKSWVECSKSMSIEDIAPKSLYKNGGTSVNLMIRIAETEKATYSKTCTITIPAQGAPPKIGDNSVDVTYYFQNKKLVLMLNKAASQNIYEYTVVKTGMIFNVSTSKWKTVNSSKAITLSQTSAPEGCKIYVRLKGTNLNSTRSIPLVLGTDPSNFTVSYKII